MGIEGFRVARVQHRAPASCLEYSNLPVLGAVKQSWQVYSRIWVGESVCCFAIRDATKLHNRLGLDTNECAGERLVPESESHWNR